MAEDDRVEGDGSGRSPQRLDLSRRAEPTLAAQVRGAGQVFRRVGPVSADAQGLAKCARAMSIS